MQPALAGDASARYLPDFIKVVICLAQWLQWIQAKHQRSSLNGRFRGARWIDARSHKAHSKVGIWPTANRLLFGDDAGKKTFSDDFPYPAWPTSVDPGDLALWSAMTSVARARLSAEPQRAYAISLQPYCCLKESEVRLAASSVLRKGLVSRGRSGATPSASA